MWVSKFGRNFDQTSTPKCRSLVEVWLKFGRRLVSHFGRQFIKFTMHFIDISSKLRANFDTGGVEVWSKFGRSLVEVSTFGVSKLVEISTKLRHPHRSKLTIVVNNPSTKSLIFENDSLFV